MKSQPSVGYLVACVALILFMASPLYAQVSYGPVTATGSVEGGAYPQTVPDASSAKYQEYRDLAQQFIVPELKLVLGDKNNDQYFAKFDLINIGQKNGIYDLHFGEYGTLDVDAQWKEIPHYFSNGVARTPYLLNDGRFSLVNKPTSSAGIESWVNANARPINLDMLEGVANLRISYTPIPYWTFSANYNFQNPTGDRAFGSLFGPNPGTYNITEIYEPIQYYIYNYGVGVQYARNGWVAGFKYQGSFFRNGNTTLTWANPDTWNNPIGPNGQCQSSATYNPAGGTGPCWGRADTYPDNQAHNFTATFAAPLPFHTQFMSSASYGFWLQNDNFIPYTINPTISQAALPRQSLRGDVQPFFVNATLVSNPIRRLQLRGTYSYYDYDNQTPTMYFKSVPALNDTASTWSAIAYPFAFSVQDIKFTASYNWLPNLATRFVGDIKTNHNWGMMVLQQDTTSYGPIIDYNPYSWLLLRASYQHAFRSSPGYDNNRTTLINRAAGADEVAAMRRFDEATLRVDKTDLSVQAEPTEKTTVYADFAYEYDNYPSSDIGTQYTSSYSPSVGASYDPVSWAHFAADYSWQAYDWRLDSFFRSGRPTACGPESAQTPYSCPQQLWASYGRSQGSGVSFRMLLNIPPVWVLKNVSRLRLNYTYSNGSNVIHASGDQGAATDFPSVGSQFDQLIVQYAYELRKNSWLKVGYMFNHYGYNNFQIDNSRQWISGSPNSMFLGDSTEIPYDSNQAYIVFKQRF